MIHYLLNFIVYTLAMSGLIFFALYVYKKVMQGTCTGKKSKLLSIIETMSISPRKTLMIVKAGDEKFLIASDIDKTTLISKLEDKNSFNIPDSEIENTNVNESSNTEVDKTMHKQSSMIGLSSIQTEIDSNIENLYKNTNKPNTFSPGGLNTKNNQPIHLEVIKDKNEYISRMRKINRERKSLQHSEKINTNNNKGLATIKKMIDKVSGI